MQLEWNRSESEDRVSVEMDERGDRVRVALMMGVE